MGEIKILHSFKMGDLLSIMPGLQHIYWQTGNKVRIYQRLNLKAYYDLDASELCMTRDGFEFLKPLIESQDYISGFEVWEGQQVDMDFDKSRDSRLIPMPAGDIHFWAWFISPELQCDLSIPWLHLEEKNDNLFTGKAIINRTSRYLNPYISYFFLRDYEDNVLFSGTPKEHEDFCREFGVNLVHLKADNFLELAKIIKKSKFLLSNQSAHFHIANGMKTPRLLECSPSYPNTYPQGQNGYVFMYQEALELQFKKLLHESIG